MPSRRDVLSSVLVSCAAAAVPAPVRAARALRPGGATLAAYRGDAEMIAAIERWQSAAARVQPPPRRALPASALSMQADAVQAPASAKAAEAGASADAITNVQTAGVDEGGIVKLAGDHLVILRRGRLFTVRVGDDALRPVASVDAYAPGSDPRGAWYDELLVSGSSVVVVGYSYARGGTEIGLFELSPDGALAYRSTWHLRSFDYFSSRNYASRLVGRRLVFYTPTLLRPWGGFSLDAMPASRRWPSGGPPPAFERILPATRVYRTDDDFDPHATLALHTVTSFDLASPTLENASVAVLGPASRVFHVSAGSVYVWTGAARAPGPQASTPGAASAVFRIPLDTSAPTALKAAGTPVDTLSFLEDGGGHLNVLLREAGEGEGMWGGERGAGPMALLRVALREFGDGSTAARAEHYRRVPGPAGAKVHNRFVGDWLVWGGAHDASTARPAPAGAWAIPYARAQAARALDPGHAVERIEAMGRDAVLVGNAGDDLHFTEVRLRRDDASLAARHVQPASRQSETRTHGFFYRPTGDDEGLLGLPVAGPDAASVLYLRRRDGAFEALGQLRSRATARADDGCKASCVDWYGNARPIFLGERVIALLGYELVEGAWGGRGGRSRIDERRRVSFAPGQALREGRYSPFG